MKFVRGGFGEIDRGTTDLVSRAGQQLRASWAFYVPERSGQMNYRTVVDAETRAVLKNSRWARIRIRRRHAASCSRTVRNPTPSRNPDRCAPVRRASACLFQGDPLASPKGWISGD